MSRPTNPDRDAVTTAPAGSEHTASLSVVVCCHDPARLGLLSDALDSLAAQGAAVSEVVVSVDHHDGLAAALERRAGDLEWGAAVRVVPSTGPKGLSGARNSGLAACSGDVVAFVDDDAVVYEGWADAVLAAFADPGVVGLGGTVDALWERGRPSWFPPEFDWVVGCTHRGRALEGDIRNPIGANMAFRAQTLRDLGGFSSKVGRDGASLLSCEETDLGIRAAEFGRVVAAPGARAAQFVPASRSRWSYFVRRCAAEGRSKARVADSVGAAKATSDELAYTTRVLPAAVWGSLRSAAAGRPGALLAALAVLVGLATTSATFVFETARLGLKRSRR